MSQENIDNQIRERSRNLDFTNDFKSWITNSKRDLISLLFNLSYKY